MAAPETRHHACSLVSQHAHLAAGFRSPPGPVSIEWMQLEVNRREREGIVILDVAGSMSGNPELLRAEVEKSGPAGENRVVLNLQAATYINSAWLGAIVQAFAGLNRAGGRLKLLNVPPKIMELLVLTKLSTIFDIFTSEEDAINSFFPDRALRFPRLMQEEALPPQLPGASKAALLVFLCHSSADKAAVRDLHHRLVRTGVRPWLDEVDLLPGQVWEREIPAAVRRSDAVLICLSQSSINRSGYLQREIKYALDAAEEQSDDSIFLIPGRLEECEVPERLRRWQWVDLFAEDGYDRLVTALQARALALQKRSVQNQE